MLNTVCLNNFVRSTTVEPATVVRRLATSYATGTRVALRRVRSLLTEMQAASFSLARTLISIMQYCTA